MTLSYTKESALEACIERHLGGGVSAMPVSGAALGDDVAPYQSNKGAGYLRGNSMDLKAEFAIDETIMHALELQEKHRSA